MEILIETLNPVEAGIIQESSQDGRNLWLSGVFMQADLLNRNGRTYPLSEIQNAVLSATQRIKEANGLFGELDHPQSLSINLDRISHVITEMNLTGTNAMGKAKILNTPMGNIARELVRSEVKLGVSSRGAGNVGTNGNVSDFQFVTVDIVATPSAPGAIPSSVYESLVESRAGQKVLSLSHQIKEDKSAQKYLEREIKKFISEMVDLKRFKI